MFHAALSVPWTARGTWLASVISVSSSSTLWIVIKTWRIYSSQTKIPSASALGLRVSTIYPPKSQMEARKVSCICSSHHFGQAALTLPCIVLVALAKLAYPCSIYIVYRDIWETYHIIDPNVTILPHIQALWLSPMSQKPWHSLRDTNILLICRTSSQRLIS